MHKITLLFFLLPTLGLCSACSSESSACDSDQDCPAGRYCDSGSCTYDCTFDQECPQEHRCTERGRCERGCVETNGGLEACDQVDNDCDELTDEDFLDLGLPCSHGDCPAGVWACLPDGSGVLCTGPQPAPDDPTCDGLDDDCDGQTDEDAQDEPCQLQAGVCQGATRTCQADGTWSECDYGPEYTPDLDDSCDLVDNDCDGQTDEDGVFQALAESGSMANDGIDNNCNGLVDEVGGIMVHIPGGFPVWIDAYEMTVFSQADCTGNRYGENSADYPSGWPAAGEATQELYACSLPDLIPSGWLSWNQANRACQAQGKRLCTSNEYGTACNGGASTWYPYGQVFVPGACNDALFGDGQAVPTGSFSGCTGGNGTYDMSGNLAEWFSEWDGLIPGTAHVGGYGFECVLCNGGINCEPCQAGNTAHEERIKVITDCNLQEQYSFESFVRDEVYPFMGARCCLDGP